MPAHVSSHPTNAQTMRMDRLVTMIAPRLVDGKRPLDVHCVTSHAESTGGIHFPPWTSADST
jgi:hypothetical protein